MTHNWIINRMDGPFGPFVFAVYSIYKWIGFFIVGVLK